MPGGNSLVTRGSSARRARDSSSGLAVACLMTPSATAERPLKRTELRCEAAPISTRPRSAIVTG
jgi:hypothetical protein